MFFEVTAGVALIAWLSRLKQKSAQLSVPGKSTGVRTGAAGNGGNGKSGGSCCGCGTGRLKANRLSTSSGDPMISPGYNPGDKEFCIGGISGVYCYVPSSQSSGQFGA